MNGTSRRLRLTRRTSIFKAYGISLIFFFHMPAYNVTILLFRRLFLTVVKKSVRNLCSTRANPSSSAKAGRRFESVVDLQGVIFGFSQFLQSCKYFDCSFARGAQATGRSIAGTAKSVHSGKGTRRAKRRQNMPSLRLQSHRPLGLES